MIETRSVLAAICDGCGKEVVGANDFEPVRGFQGDVADNTGTLGQGGDWFACSKRCIGKAVVACLTRGYAGHSPSLEGPAFEQGELA